MIWISLLMLVLFSMIVYAFSATTGSQISGDYRMQVTLVNQEPDPVGPGEVLDVRFKFENKGGGNAEDITVELLPDHPFSLYTNENATNQIGSIHGRQIGDRGVIVKYRLKVDENAVEGDTNLELKYRLGDLPWIKLDSFQIDIQTGDAILSVEDVQIARGMIKPGEKTAVNLKLKNLADSLLKDIRVKLDLVNVPIAPIGSSNEKTIKRLIGGENATLGFYLMAEPDADSKLYKVPLYINYLDGVGTAYTRNNTIGLIIGDKPDLTVIIDSSDIYRSGGSGDVVIKFVNKGVTDIKFLNVGLVDTDEFKIISPAEVYVGNIDSDDYETADFKISLGKIRGKEVILPFLVEYKDANNNDYIKDVPLSLKLYSTSEAKQAGLAQGSSKVGIFIVIIIVVGGLFGYRKWKRKKKAKK